MLFSPELVVKALKGCNVHCQDAYIEERQYCILWDTSHKGQRLMVLRSLTCFSLSRCAEQCIQKCQTVNFWLTDVPNWGLGEGSWFSYSFPWQSYISLWRETWKWNHVLSSLNVLPFVYFITSLLVSRLFSCSMLWQHWGGKLSSFFDEPKLREKDAMFGGSQRSQRFFLNSVSTCQHFPVNWDQSCFCFGISSHWCAVDTNAMNQDRASVYWDFIPYPSFASGASRTGRCCRPHMHMFGPFWTRHDQCFSSLFYQESFWGGRPRTWAPLCVVRHSGATFVCIFKAWLSVEAQVAPWAEKVVRNWLTRLTCASEMSERDLADATEATAQRTELEGTASSGELERT